MNTIIQIFLWVLLACPISAFILNCCLIFRANAAARWAGYCIGVGFITSIGLLSYLSISHHSELYLLLNINTLNLLLCSLVLLVSFIVHRFSLRYMHGDSLYRRFFLLLSTLTLAAILMVLSNNLFLFWGAWSLSNLFLVLLMVHKKEWVASKNSGLLALFTLSLGSVCVLSAFMVLSVTYSTNSISTLVQLPNLGHSLLLSLSIGLILVGGLAQSGVFPFHRWLISSLNSPTPVSALMHAGLVNGGGILMVKLAPLMMFYPSSLKVLFLIGAISAILGTAWKLMQPDVKKMLACSTMAQMGFMMMQCGVGLFAAAIAHLCWHGLFKAYLFLSSGSAVKQQKPETQLSKKSPVIFIATFIGGLIAMIAFAFVTHKPISVYEASSFVLFFAFIAGAQLMFSWIRNQVTVFDLISGFVLALLAGTIYGTSIQLIQGLIPDVVALQAPKLSIIHWITMAVFGVLWAVFTLGAYQKIVQSNFGCWLYMNLFNSSQPSKKTITALRNDYNY